MKFHFEAKALHEQTVEELRGRLKLGQFLLGMVKRSRHDANRAAAIDNLRAQMHQLEAEIARREGKPPPVVVKMDALKITGKAPGMGK